MRLSALFAFLSLKKIVVCRSKRRYKKINFREGVKLLSKNKYVIILALALLVTNISMNLGAVNPFYFEQVVGDISKQSVVNALGAVGPLLVLCLPILAKKWEKETYCNCIDSWYYRKTFAATQSTEYYTFRYWHCFGNNRIYALVYLNNQYGY